LLIGALGLKVLDLLTIVGADARGREAPLMRGGWINTHSVFVSLSSLIFLAGAE